MCVLVHMSSFAEEEEKIEEDLRRIAVLMSEISLLTEYSQLLESIKLLLSTWKDGGQQPATLVKLLHDNINLNKEMQRRRRRRRN